VGGGGGDGGLVFQKITENITERGKKIMKTELN
jgi:hypothetical protein